MIHINEMIFLNLIKYYDKLHTFTVSYFIMYNLKTGSKKATEKPIYYCLSIIVYQFVHVVTCDF